MPIVNEDNTRYPKANKPVALKNTILQIFKNNTHKNTKNLHFPQSEEKFLSLGTDTGGKIVLELNKQVNRAYLTIKKKRKE